MSFKRAKASAMRWLLPVATGGSVFFLNGCDDEVRSTVLDGLNSAATGLAEALLNAFFQGLSDGSDTARLIIDGIQPLIA